MKDCCKNGCQDKSEEFGLKKWLNYILYIIITVVVVVGAFM